MSRTNVTLFAALVATLGIAGVHPSVSALRDATTRTLYVTVLDNDGQPVTGLTPADFRVREAGRDREITSVEPAAEPMRIAVMVEELLTSAGGVRQGIFEFAKVMVTHGDISLIVVGLSNREAVPYTTDLRAIVSGINDLPRSQPQRIGHVPEGIFQVARVFAKERPARPVMVVISLDSQQASSEEPQNVLNNLKDSNAQLHVVAIQTSQTASDVVGAAGAMEASGRAQVLGDGPRQSGGRQWPVNALTGVPKAMLSIANELSNQYRITYVLPDGVEASDRVNVTISRRGTALRAPTRIWDGD
jgi:VWFA-related protein